MVRVRWVGPIVLAVVLACSGLPAPEPPPAPEPVPSPSPGSATAEEPPLGRCALDEANRAPLEGPFFMRVEDVFEITGRGQVATGRIVRGCVAVGDALQLNGRDRVEIAGVEKFRKKLDRACANENVGLLLAGRTDLSSGAVLAEQDSGQAVTFVQGRAVLEPDASLDGANRLVVDGVELPANAHPGPASADGSIAFEATLDPPAPLLVGECVRLRQGGRTLARGVVRAGVPLSP